MSATSTPVLIRPTHWRFAKGHRLRIAVTMATYRPSCRTHRRGSTVTIANGAGGSWIDLPFR